MKEKDFSSELQRSLRSWCIRGAIIFVTYLGFTLVEPALSQFSGLAARNELVANDLMHFLNPPSSFASPPIQDIEDGGPFLVSGTCQEAFVELRSVEVTRDKGGFAPFTTVPNPQPRYLTRIVTEEIDSYSKTNNVHEDGTCTDRLLQFPMLPHTGDLTFAADLSWSNCHIVEVYFYTNGAYSGNSCSFAKDDVDEGKVDAADFNFSIPSMDDPDSGSNSDDAMADGLATTFSGGSPDSWMRPSISYKFSGVFVDDCYATGRVSYTPDSHTGYGIFKHPTSNCPADDPSYTPYNDGLILSNIVEHTHNESSTERWITNGVDGSSSESWVPCRQIHVLSNEFTEAMFIAQVNQDMADNLPDWGDAFETNICNGTQSTGVAETSSYRFLTNNSLRVTLRRVDLRLRIPDSDPNLQYQVSWVTDNGSGPENTAPETYIGTGGTLYTSIYTNMPPSSDGEVSVVGVQISARSLPHAHSGGPGCAPCGKGGAGTPGTVPGKNSLWAGDGDIQMKFSLGMADFENAAGYLRFQQAAATSELAEPSALFFEGDYEKVTISTNSLGVITQIDAPQVQAKIVDRDYEYDIEFYAEDGGSYESEAYATYTVKNPNGSTNQHTLQVIEERNSQYITNEFKELGSYKWQLKEGNDLRGTKTTTTHNGDQTVTVLREIFDPDSGDTLTSVEEKYQTNDWGVVLLSHKVDPSGLNLESTFLYDNLGRLTQSVTWDGAWNVYMYDSDNRLMTNFMNWGNQEPTMDESLCRMVTYGYDVVSMETEILLDMPRTVVESIEGEEVSRTYFIYTEGIIKEYNMDLAGESWSDDGGLKTVREFYTSGIYEGDPSRTIYPDDTRDVYFYSTSGTDNIKTILSGSPDTMDDTNILAGTITKTTLGEFGEVKSVYVYDKPSTIAISSEVHSYDSQERRTNTVYLDGTQTSTSYSDCCNADTITDRAGTVTTYDLDDLGRLSATTRDGITVSNYYDARGLLLSRDRIASNPTTITLERNGYDKAQRIVATTNALDEASSYSYVFDGQKQLTVTTTHDDTGVTRIATYARDGNLLKISGTSVHGVRYEYGSTNDTSLGTFTREIFLNSNGTDSDEYTLTFTDLLGRQVKRFFADGKVETSTFNSKGQLEQQVDADSVSTLYAYNDKGEREYTAIELSRNNTMDFSGANGTDRITRTYSHVTNDVHGEVRRTITLRWHVNGTDTHIGISTNDVSVTGINTWSAVHGITNHILIHYAGNGDRYVTNYANDGSYTLTHYNDGRMESVGRYMPNDDQISLTTYGYDSHGRQSSITDARNGTTLRTFDDLDRVLTLTTPSPGTGQSAQTATQEYDSLGRIEETTLPDGGVVNNEYFNTGELKKTSGTRTYPVEYTYDYRGRMETMMTWQDHAGDAGTATTTWAYHSERGYLTQKEYDDGSDTDYTYTDAGRLKTRVWDRGITTTYAYNNAGDLSSISYDDAVTPTITYNYDRLGRRTNIVDGVGSHYLKYNRAGHLIQETNRTGVLAGFSITNVYDSILRRGELEFFDGTTSKFDFAYTYDDASRLESVSDGTYSANYSYHANSSLVDEIVFKETTTTRMTTSRVYDNLNRLLHISNVPSDSGEPTVSYAYAYNKANQRFMVRDAQGAYWQYRYDDLGQVISGKKYWSDGTPVAGQQFEYVFDDIGNRSSTKAGGDNQGGNLRESDYEVNSLNQYTTRDVPGEVDIIGIAKVSANVTIDGASTYRRGEYFHKAITVTNTFTPGFHTTDIEATLGTDTNSLSGDILLPSRTNDFSHVDGNLTSDGLWDYTWNGENRLIEMASVSGVTNTAKHKLVFEYDYKGRRVHKEVYDWDEIGMDWDFLYERKYIYDGWNLVAELDGSDTLLRSYMWGLDLSGSEQGAGGVGGLLAIDDKNEGTHFVGYDGNGNVTLLVAGDAGKISGNYEYGPFGEGIRASTETISVNNPFRFSSKYQDLESDLLYYGYRFYDPSTGRWLNKDPIGELGGLALYLNGKNDLINYFDLFGLARYEWDGQGLHVHDGSPPNLLTYTVDIDENGNVTLGPKPGHEREFDLEKAKGSWRAAISNKNEFKKLKAVIADAFDRFRNNQEKPRNCGRGLRRARTAMRAFGILAIGLSLQPGNTEAVNRLKGDLLLVHKFLKKGKCPTEDMKNDVLISVHDVFGNDHIALHFRWYLDDLNKTCKCCDKIHKGNDE